MTNLLSCPFCGSTAVFEGEEKNGAPHLPQMRCVSCSECDSYGPEHWTDEEAITAWNTRPSIEALQAENEKWGAVVQEALDFAAAFQARAHKAEAQRDEAERRCQLATSTAERVVEERDAFKARVDALEAGLRPFAEAADIVDENTHNAADIVDTGAAWAISHGDLRQARALLTPQGEQL